MLSDDVRETFATAICAWWDDEDGGMDPGHAEERPCRHCRREADALAPLIAAAEARGAAAVLERVEALHRTTDGQWCDEDGFGWPCATVRAAPTPEGGRDE